MESGGKAPRPPVGLGNACRATAATARRTSATGCDCRQLEATSQARGERTGAACAGARPTTSSMRASPRAKGRCARGASATAAASVRLASDLPDSRFQCGSAGGARGTAAHSGFGQAQGSAAGVARRRGTCWTRPTRRFRRGPSGASSACPCRSPRSIRLVGLAARGSAAARAISRRATRRGRTATERARATRRAPSSSV